ncbi:hypothetical protein [Serinibacter salmoneus]|uniref:DUF4352 domain-containing protein n=1 Tax=Serinibacter salmoneus TaxID=556530 RepID=A0A2A9CXV7_9MICO|nr:hypothetical protein [Serinibacter salmoneus]PFG18502.1 hypothetical protein ATL40_0038 [Serinibacter salmoneus]
MSTPTTPAPVPPGTPPAPDPSTSRPRRTLGIIALVTAILGFLFAVIPGAMLVGWILLPIAFVLAIVAMFQPPSRILGIWALVVSVLGGVIGAIVFVVLVAGAVDEAFSEDEVTVETAAEAEDAEEETEAEAAAQDESQNESEGESEGAAGQVGTRDNPAPLGSVITGEEWEVVIDAVQLDATDAVMAANQFNDPPADGEAYLIVTVTTTYLGQDSSYDSMVDVDYVTADGTVITSSDNFAVAPEPEFGMTELFTGASSTGNIVLAAPLGDTGLLRVTPGLFADDVFVALN